MSVRLLRGAGLSAAAALLAAGGMVAAMPSPANAAPSTKNYDAYVSPVNGTPATSLDVGPGAKFTVWLENDPRSQQSFGSARITIGNLPATDWSVSGFVTDATFSNGSYAGTTSTAWTSQSVSTSPGTVQLDSAASSDAIPPGAALGVEITLASSLPSGVTETIATAVKQSNNFSGPNNQFTELNPSPSVQVQQICSSSTCDTGTLTSSSTGVTADVQITPQNQNAGSFLYTAAFGTGVTLGCESSVTGSYTSDPLYLDTGSTTVSKVITMVFPRSVVNENPNNGTPLMPVCGGSNESFPGSTKTSSGTYEGLLLDCSDPSYTTTGYSIAPCVSSRAKSGGSETIVITVPSAGGDYFGMW